MRETTSILLATSRMLLLELVATDTTCILHSLLCSPPLSFLSHSPHYMAAPVLLTIPTMDEEGAPPPAPASPSRTPPQQEPKPAVLRWRPPVRVTSEFDSERRLFSHRLSCRVLDGLAKLRLRISHGAGGGGILWGPTDVGLLARNFSVVVDPATRGAVLRGAADLAGSLRLRASHNTKVRPLIDCAPFSSSNFVADLGLGVSTCRDELGMIPTWFN